MREWFIQLKNYYIREYRFLRWDNLTWDGICAYAESFITDDVSASKKEIKTFLNEQIRLYLIKQIQDGKVEIFNDYLKELISSYNNLFEVLKEFFHKLDFLHITFSSKYFLQLKNDSLVFQQILDRLKIDGASLDEVQNNLVLANFYKKMGNSKEAEDFFQNYLHLYFLDEQEKIIKQISAESFIAKMNFIFLNRDVWKEIYHIYVASNPVDSRLFNKVLFSLEDYVLKELVLKFVNNNLPLNFLDGYMEREIAHKYRKYKRRLYAYLNSNVAKVTCHDGKRVDEIFLKLTLNQRWQIVERLVEKEQFDLKDIGDFEQKYFLVRTKTLYDYIAGKNEVLSSEDKKVIDYLFNELSLERQEGIKGFINKTYHTKDEVGARAMHDTQLLKAHFKKYKKTGSYEKTLYDYFKNDDGDISSEDKKIVDDLFNGLSHERQNGIKGYIKGIYHYNDELGDKARRDISYLQLKFRKIKVKLNLTIYDYFKDENGYISDTDKQALDVLMMRLPSDRQVGLNNYIKGLNHTTDAIGALACNDLVKIKAWFLKYKETGIYEKTIYDYLRDDGDISSEDEEVIDILFSQLSLERQERINTYIKNLYYSRELEGTKAYNDIMTLKRRFQKYKETGKYQRSIYDYFGDADGFVTDFEKQVIDQLFLALPLEDQENLNYYLQKKNYLCDVNRARDVIEILRVRFNKVLMLQIKKVYLKVYQIKHLQNLKNTTLERKK